MKTNHRRKNPKKSGHDYSYLNYMKRLKNALPFDHDGGHKGSHIEAMKDLNISRFKLNKLLERNIDGKD